MQFDQFAVDVEGEICRVLVILTMFLEIKLLPSAQPSREGFTKSIAGIQTSPEHTRQLHPRTVQSPQLHGSIPKQSLIYLNSSLETSMLVPLTSSSATG